jgi:hypothetical protein
LAIQSATYWGTLLGCLVVIAWYLAIVGFSANVTHRWLLVGMALVVVSRIVAWRYRAIVEGVYQLSIVWPFADHASLREANANCHMLGKSS